MIVIATDEVAMRSVDYVVGRRFVQVATDLGSVSIQDGAGCRAENGDEWPHAQGPYQSPEITTSPRQDVQMDVRHGLIGGPSVIDQEMKVVAVDVAGSQGLGDLGTQREQVTASCHVHLVDVLIMGCGDDQDVTRSPGIDVHEGQKLTTTTDHAGRRLSADDVTEDTHGWYFC